MIKRFYEIFFKLPNWLKTYISRRWYELVSVWDKEADMIFMNLGWSSLNSTADKLHLDKSDEPNRYQIQLYHHVVNGIDLKGMDVLEVGCGRGGGASFVKRYHNPATLVGLDITSKAIKFCQNYYNIDNLTFQKGDAESLEFDDNTFDVVLNIESSHIYSNMQKFLRCVYRVLKPGGYFLLADACFKEDIYFLRDSIKNSKFKLKKEENISENVLRALELDSDRKIELIQRKAPKLFRGLISEFAGTKDSKNSAFTFLHSGKLEFFNFCMQK